MPAQSIRTAKERETLLQDVKDMTGKHANPRVSVKTACNEIGISRSTYYRWRNAYRQDNTDGLKSKSRAPHHPRRMPETLREELIAAARTGDWRSANALATEFRRRGYRTAAKTVINLLESVGLYRYVVVTNASGRKVKKRVITARNV